MDIDSVAGLLAHSIVIIVTKVVYFRNNCAIFFIVVDYSVKFIFVFISPRETGFLN